MAADPVVSMPGAESSRGELQARLVRLDKQSRAAEALADVVAVIQQHVERGRRGLAICGAAAGTGVSFVTASLALATAQAGIRTLVIEANVRDPSLATLIPPPSPPASGLLPFLLSQHDDPATLVESEVSRNLSVIYAGGAAENAADLFDTDRFEQVMLYALRTYDLTLVDTPPANRCAEARRIAAVAGYAAIVARRNVTMADDVKTLIADLRLDRTDIIGSILNEG